MGPHGMNVSAVWFLSSPLTCFLLSRTPSIPVQTPSSLALDSDFLSMSLAHGHVGDMSSRLTVITVLKSCFWYHGFVYSLVSLFTFDAGTMAGFEREERGYGSAQLLEASTHVGPYANVRLCPRE